MIKINPDTIPILWYENQEGDRWVPSYKDNESPPDGFIYQHSRFPTVLRHNILKVIQREEVDACNHTDSIVKTGGWTEGLEGRKCRRCGGSQLKDIDKPWPEEWDASGSQQVFTGESSYSEDLVVAMLKDYSLSQAILIAATCCERCMNAFAYGYGLTWGYEIFSDEWQAARTVCQFCSLAESDGDNNG